MRRANLNIRGQSDLRQKKANEIQVEIGIQGKGWHLPSLGNLRSPLQPQHARSVFGGVQSQPATCLGSTVSQQGSEGSPHASQQRDVAIILRGFGGFFPGHVGHAWDHPRVFLAAIFHRAGFEASFGGHVGFKHGVAKHRPGARVSQGLSHKKTPQAQMVARQ